MSTVDLFDEHPEAFAPHLAGDASHALGRRAPRRPVGGGRTAARPHGRTAVAGDRHYRLAMRAARRLPAADHREMTARLICHHLRCMLDD